ncbi:MAG: Pr6Pr family membrane protein [Parvibaculaceae bacterium]
MPHPHFRLTFRLLAAAVGWFALFLQYWLAMQADAGLSPVQRTVNFFSYFTILANLLAALAMTLPSLTPGSAAGRFFARPSVRGAIAAWIMVVAFVYVLVLRQLWNPQGWAFVADASLHYLAPALFVLDWLLFVPRRSLKPRQALWWLVLPVIYGLWTVLHGAVSGFHP